MKSTILLVVLGLAIAGSIYMTYDRTIVRHDYEVFDSEAELEEETLEEEAVLDETEEAPQDEALLEGEEPSAEEPEDETEPSSQE